MKKTSIILILISFMFLSINAENNFILNTDHIEEAEITTLNKKLNDLANSNDFFLYVDIGEENIDFDDIDKKDATMLFSVNLIDNTYNITSTPKASALYNKKAQNAFFEKNKDDLSNHSFSDIIIKLANDIETTLKLKDEESKTKVLFSPKRLIFALVIGFLIALVMSQSQKNKLKTFTSRKTANTYISDFKIIDKKDIKTSEKNSVEYVDKKNTANTQSGASGKF